MTKFHAPNVPFVEARHTGSKQKPTAIVLDLSMTTSDKGAALGIATRLHKRNAPANSYHYIVDEAQIYRGVWDNVAAHNSPYRAIDILICAQPHERVAMWEDATAKSVLTRAAELVADLILTYKIKPRYLSEVGEMHWKKHRTRRRGGIIIRVPGEWPSRSFLTDVKTHLVMKTS